MLENDKSKYDVLTENSIEKTNKPTFKRNFRGLSRLKSIQNDETVAGEEEQQNIKTIEIEETNLDDSDGISINSNKCYHILCFICCCKFCHIST